MSFLSVKWLGLTLEILEGTKTSEESSIVTRSWLMAENRWPDEYYSVSIVLKASG